MKRKHFLHASVLSVVLGLASCTGTIQDGPTKAHPAAGDAGAQPAATADGGTVEIASTDAATVETHEDNIPFEALQIPSYVMKVKTLMTGLPPTSAETRAVMKDPGALRGLIDQWMATPQYNTKMMEFFGNAFQQTQVNQLDLIDQAGGAGFIGPFYQHSLQNMRESFARTALQLIAEGRPFSETLTTKRFMLTPALMAFYGYIDDVRQGDDPAEGTASEVMEANQDFAFWVTDASGPIPLSETLNPKSPNYLHWYNTALPHQKIYPETNDLAPCVADPRKTSRFEIQSSKAYVVYSLWELIEGGNFPGINPALGVRCEATEHSPSQFTEQDFNAWRMVTIRQPVGDEPVTPFYDLQTFRTGKELVFRIPRVGFFTTLSFFAQWMTNINNVALVTTNQTLIGALGKAFTMGDTAVPPFSDTSAKKHATGVCLACHGVMDPMSQFFRQSYSISYHPQRDPKQTTKPGVYLYDDASNNTLGKGIDDLAKGLASSPHFAPGWTQKLCYYANSAPCAEDDPEFLRVVDVFKKSNLSWPALVRELFSSPLVTAASRTDSAGAIGVTTTIARRDAFCDLMSFRLGIPNVCGLGAITSNLDYTQQQLRPLASMMQGDGYSRGNAAPFLSNSPTLFFRGGIEGMCGLIADRAIDADKATYSSKTPDDIATAIKDFAENIMALPDADPRSNEAKQILTNHFNDAKQISDSPADALKSTFVLACTSPSTIAIGL